jgi:DNA polymerase III alpha subunit (gram-positive type)
MKPNSLHYESPIVFDLETSNADTQTAEIIQIAAIHPVSGETFERKIEFDVDRANTTALEVNSYDEAAWEEHAVPIHVGLGDFVRFCHRHTNIQNQSARGYKWKSVALMGYNSQVFDMPIINRVGKATFTKFFSPWGFRNFDILQWAQLIYPGYVSYKLTAMAAMLDVFEPDAHDALVDCRMTLAIARKVLTEVFDSKGLPSWVTDE